MNSSHQIKLSNTIIYCFDFLNWCQMYFFISIAGIWWLLYLLSAVRDWKITKINFYIKIKFEKYWGIKIVYFMLFLKSEDQNVFVIETYGMLFIFGIFFILVPFFSTLPFPKKSRSSTRITLPEKKLRIKMNFWHMHGGDQCYQQWFVRVLIVPVSTVKKNPRIISSSCSFRI